MSEEAETGDPVLYSAPVIIRKMKGYYLALNAEAPNMMVVDEVGRRILELCGENERRNRVVRRISKRCSCSEQDVEHFIDSLIAAKFVAENLPPRFTRGKKTAKLEALQLHLTQACNLRCKHCYFSSGKSFEDELTDEEYIDLVKSCGQIGIVGLTITGGEPFLRRELLFEVIQEANLQGIKNITLSTNGTLLTEDDAVLLKKYDVKTGISLDGATEQTHDYIRGKGVFNKAVNTLTILQEAGVHTTIGWTLMKANIKEAEKILYLAKEKAVSGVNFNTVRIKGRARENIRDTEISTEDALAVLMQIWAASRKLGVRTAMEGKWERLKGLPKKDLCGAGKSVLCIAANGDVYPCDAFHGEASFKAGNVRKEPLIDIWRKSPVLKPFFSISVDRVEGCRDCELKYICGGGCMEDNFEDHGTLTKASFTCSLLKSIYWQMIPRLAEEMWQKSK